MSDELFEVVFSGQISEGAVLIAVRVQVGKMFKADGAKLDHLFSGQRIVIKKGVDQQTAQKYKKALNSVGAECTIEPMAAAAPSAPAPPPAAPAEPAPANASTADAAPKPSPAPVAQSAARDTAADATGDDDLLPPQTAPLGVTADQIDDLAATLAPVGSELLDEVEKVPEPQFDLSALEMAPVGSTMSDPKKEPPPPPPDTSGLSMVD